MRQARLIINPKSGVGRGYRYARRIRRRLAASGLTFHTSFGRNVGDIEHQARKACDAGYKIIVVVGGDGTVHEAANAVLERGSDVTLGLIPMGTGNDFARATGVPEDWRKACDLIVDSIRAGTSRRVDAGRCNDFFFANGVGVGLDARVTIASESLKWLPGALAYVLALIIVMVRGIPRARAKISCDGNEIAQEVSMIATCNGAWLGGVFFIAPEARPDDGMLQVVIAEGLSRLAVMRLAPKALKGTHVNEPIAKFIDCRAVRIKLERPLPVESDGEVRCLAATALDIELLPGALKVFGSA